MGLSLKSVESLNEKKMSLGLHETGDMKHNKFSCFGNNPNTILWYMSVFGYAKNVQ